MELALKGALGAALAIAFTLLGRSQNGTLAGVLALFPVFSLLGYALVASSGGAATMREAAKVSTVAAPVLLAFFAAVWILAPKLPWQATLLVALSIWLILAAIWLRWVL